MADLVGGDRGAYSSAIDDDAPVCHTGGDEPPDGMSEDWIIHYFI
jgi:hypothetical protein